MQDLCHVHEVLIDGDLGTFAGPFALAALDSNAAHASSIITVRPINASCVSYVHATEELQSMSHAEEAGPGGSVLASGLNADYHFT